MTNIRNGAAVVALDANGDAVSVLVQMMGDELEVQPVDGSQRVDFAAVRRSLSRELRRPIVPNEVYRAQGRSRN